MPDLTGADYARVPGLRLFLWSDGMSEAYSLCKAPMHRELSQGERLDAAGFWIGVCGMQVLNYGCHQVSLKT